MFNNFQKKYLLLSILIKEFERNDIVAENNNLSNTVEQKGLSQDYQLVSLLYLVFEKPSKIRKNSYWKSLQCEMSIKIPPLLSIFSKLNISLTTLPPSSM